MATVNLTLDTFEETVMGEGITLVEERFLHERVFNHGGESYTTNLE